jgi:hypothetical protein
MDAANGSGSGLDAFRRRKPHRLLEAHDLPRTAPRRHGEAHQTLCAFFDNDLVRMIDEVIGAVRAQRPRDRSSNRR